MSSEHREHVHAGWLRPGAVAVNQSERPEPILTERQWDDIKRLSDNK